MWKVMWKVKVDALKFEAEGGIDNIMRVEHYV